MTAQAPLTIPGVDFAAIGPELVLGVGGVLLLVAGAWIGERRKGLLGAAALAVLAASAAAAAPGAGRSAQAFSGALLLDGFATFLKVLLAAGAAVAVIVIHQYLSAEEGPATELYGLTILATAGMMLMASAGDLVVIFLALEIFSLALYVLTAFRRRRLDSQEGGLKYFLTGSFSSAFLLYGIALVYGGTGTTRLAEIAEVLSGDGPRGAGLVAAGLALLLVGLAFKVAAVPFHNWTPDAYQGAPAPVTGFMAAGSKAAGFAALLRVTAATFPSVAADWQPAVAALAVLSMAIGSVVAVAQSNVKRMLAYSAIAHSGFLLIGVAAANPRGVSGALFYLAVYTFVIIGAFAVVYAVGRPGEVRVDLDDYRGLWQRQPVLAVTMAVLLVSLAGIPPTAGFWAKFEVFSAAASAGYLSLVVLGVLASAVAAFFYLRVIALMFLEPSPGWAPHPEPTPPAAGLAALVGAAVVAVVGLAPQPLLDLARSATFVFP